MKTYRIKQTSQITFILTLLSALFIVTGILFFIDPNNNFPKWVFMSLSFAAIIGGFFLTRYTSVAEIELIIDQAGVKKKWLKQFPFQKKPNIKIDWEEIQEYNFEPDREFDKFYIISKKGSKFKLTHNNSHKDDFEKFLRDFESKVKRNNADKNDENDIIKSKNIYEGKTGLVLAGFGILILILLFSVILFSNNKPRNYAGIGVITVAIVYYIHQVYLHRK